VDFEALRASYRPEHVRILFLGESVPAGGTFFYSGNSNLVRHTCEAFAAVFGTPRDAHAFPQVFRDRGCHLVDLCSAPVNGLDRVARRKARNAGIPALARNLRELRPECVVVVGKAIESYCQKALKTGGWVASLFLFCLFPLSAGSRNMFAGFARSCPGCRSRENKTSFGPLSRAGLFDTPAGASTGSATGSPLGDARVAADGVEKAPLKVPVHGHRCRIRRPSA